MNYDKVIDGVGELSDGVLLLSDLLATSDMPKKNTARFHLVKAAEHLTHAGIALAKSQKQDADNRTVSND